MMKARTCGASATSKAPEGCQRCERAWVTNDQSYRHDERKVDGDGPGRLGFLQAVHQLVPTRHGEDGEHLEDTREKVVERRHAVLRVGADLCETKRRKKT